MPFSNSRYAGHTEMCGSGRAKPKVVRDSQQQAHSAAGPMRAGLGVTCFGFLTLYRSARPQDDFVNCHAAVLPKQGPWHVHIESLFTTRPQV